MVMAVHLPHRTLEQVPGSEPEAARRSEAEIIQGVIDGQRWANAALYDSLYPVVARTLQKLLRDASGDYEDLVQTSFEQIVRSLTKKGRSVVNIESWAGAITAHVAVDALRARIRDRRVFRLEEAPLPSSPDSTTPSLDRQVEARWQLQWLQGVLARMRPQHSEILILCDVLGHDLSEASSLTGVSPAAAQRRLSRARSELLRRTMGAGRRGRHE